MLCLVNEWMRKECWDWLRAQTGLIKKDDKETYDVVKLSRMIDVLPTIVKVVERIIQKKITDCVELEETQYSSRKNRWTQDEYKQVSSFIEYNKGIAIGIVMMDVEGGFDKVEFDTSSIVLGYRGCKEVLKRRIRRWTSNRWTKLRFNCKISKVCNVNKRVLQGSQVSQFLLGVYMVDIFRPRFMTRMNLRRMVSSLVDMEQLWY